MWKMARLMDAAKARAPRYLKLVSRSQPAVARPLTPFERILLAALDDQYVSASVVRDRARLMPLEATLSVPREMLACGRPIAPCYAACDELERRGLAERLGVGRGARWRRAKTEKLSIALGQLRVGL